MARTIGSIVLDARAEHPSFTRDRHTNRDCVSHLSERHRNYYKALADDLKDRLTIEVPLTEGALVAIGSDGVVYAVASGVSGHLLLVGRADGVVYVSVAEALAGDFTLPADSLQIVAMEATLTSGVRVPVSWVPRGRNSQYGVSNNLVGTVTGFMFRPIRNPNQAPTLWDDVTELVVVYVPEPTEFDDQDAAVLQRRIEIPTVYGDVLKWDLAAFMARREMAMDPKNFPKSLLDFFVAQAAAVRADTKTTAPLDHRVQKVHRTVRNR